MTPETWTLEQASRARNLLTQYPDDDELKAALAKYDDVQATRRSLQRPPEHMPPAQPGPMGLKSLLPLSHGGDVEHWYEPDRAEVLSLLGGNVPEGVDANLLAKDYADARWAQAYDAAKAEGRRIVRIGHSAADEERLNREENQRAIESLGYGRNGVGEGLWLLNGFLPGSAALLEAGAKVGGDAVTTAKQFLKGEPIAGEGAGTDAANYLRDAREEVSPGARFGLGVMGSVLPGSPLGRVAGWAAKKVGLDRTSGLIPGALKGAALGGAMGAAGGTTEDVAQGITDAFEGKDAPTLHGIASRAPDRFMVGASLGLLGGLGSGLAGSNRDPFTARGRALTDFEKAGGTTSISEGFSPPPTVTGYFKNRGAFEEPLDLAIEKVKKVIPSEGKKLAAETLAPIERENAAYYNSPEGKEKVPMTSMVKTTVDLLRERTFQPGEAPSGEADLPVFDNRALRQALSRMADPVVAVDHQARQIATANNGLKVNLDEALHLGLVEPHTQVQLPNGGRASAGAIDPRSHSVVFVPRSLNAKDADAVISEVDRAAGISEASGGGKADPMYRDFTRSAREVRDQFKDNAITANAPPVTIEGPDGSSITVKGWSALKHAHSEALRELKGTLRRAGLPGESFDPEDPAVIDAVASRLQNVGGGAGRLEVDRALRKLACRAPGGDQMVNDVAATRLLEGLRPIANMERAQRYALPSTTYVSGGLVNAARYRVDPFARFAGVTAPGAAAVAGAHTSSADYRNLLQLADRLRREQTSP
jgi:hypothetical protein